MISSALPVVPSRIRSRPASSDQVAEPLGEAGQLKPGGQEAGGLRALPGRGQDEHNVYLAL